MRRDEVESARRMRGRRTVRTRRAHGVRWVFACAALALSAAACGGDAPEQRLEQAADRVRGAREEVRNARRALEAELSEANRKRAEVADARESLESAQQKLSQASTRLEQRATDVALFRAIQKELLEDDELAESAVLAHVRDGVVTLYGSTPSAETRQHALDIVRDTPGVASVTSNVAVTSVEQADAARTDTGDARDTDTGS